jgi:hypothetical protein
MNYGNILGTVRRSLYSDISSQRQKSTAMEYHRIYFVATCIPIDRAIIIDAALFFALEKCLLKVASEMRCRPLCVHNDFRSNMLETYICRKTSKGTFSIFFIKEESKAGKVTRRHTCYADKNGTYV